ncbi:lysine exporter protein LysE/YggA [Pseudomonas putida S11]|nr:lysine exporter protein LysE/YggA [Pseudomonas putida S11]
MSDEPENRILTRSFAFTLVAAIAIASPGPATLMAINNSLAHGQRSAIWSSLGNGSGLFCLSAAAMLGLGALLASSEMLFNAVKILGAGVPVLFGRTAIAEKEPDAGAGRCRGCGQGSAHAAEAIQVGLPHGSDQPQGDHVLHRAVPAVHRPGGGAAAAVPDPDRDIRSVVAGFAEPVCRTGGAGQGRADPAVPVALGEPGGGHYLYRFWRGNPGDAPAGGLKYEGRSIWPIKGQPDGHTWSRLSAARTDGCCSRPQDVATIGHRSGSADVTCAEGCR